MAERKTAEEKLQELEKKMEQLQAQKKAITAKLNKEKRAERTRRLIQLGALSEKYFACTDIQPEEYEKLLQRFVEIDAIKAIVSKKENSVVGE